MTTIVRMYAPTDTGTVTGADGLDYRIIGGIVEVANSCVTALLATGYSRADTPEMDTAAEIATLTGITATAAELNYNDIATLGTGAASKAVVLNAGDDYTWPASGILTYGVLKDSAGTTLSATAAELNVLASVTGGTTAASKGLVLDAAESLNWATTDATASETCTLTVTDTRTGAGAVGWAGKFDLTSNVALGSYANGLYGIVNFGASGRVTGLAAGVVSETVLSAGCTQGTYAGLEVELGMPANAVTGTETSLLYLSVYGAAAGAFDTSGFLFSLVGVTKNTGKMLADATTGATERPKQCLRVKTPDGTRYIPLYDTVAIAA